MSGSRRVGDNQYIRDLSSICRFVQRYREVHGIMSSRTPDIKKEELDGNPVEFLGILVQTEIGFGDWHQVINDPVVANSVAQAIHRLS